MESSTAVVGPLAAHLVRPWFAPAHSRVQLATCPFLRIVVARFVLLGCGRLSWQVV